MIDEEFLDRLVDKLRPKCPYCGFDVTYAYFGYDGRRYCPNCMRELVINE